MLVVYVIDSLWLINIMCIFIWPILGAKVELRGKSFVIGFEFLRYLNVKAVTHHGARTFKKSHYYQGSILLIDLKKLHGHLWHEKHTDILFRQFIIQILLDLSVGKFKYDSKNFLTLLCESWLWGKLTINFQFDIRNVCVPRFRLIVSKVRNLLNF